MSSALAPTVLTNQRKWLAAHIRHIADEIERGDLTAVLTVDGLEYANRTYRAKCCSLTVVPASEPGQGAVKIPGFC